MILGNLVVITQTSMKCMLAYSSISQIGYLMIGIIAGDHNGYASMMIYLLFYIFTNLRTFACIILFHWPAKKGPKPWGCGNAISRLPHLMCSPLDSGIATWTKCPVQARELIPKSPDKWWNTWFPWNIWFPFRL
jgi:hypothetical protein